MTDEHDSGSGFVRSRAGVALIAFGVIAAFFLLSEHRAHFFGWLPYLLLLACPLMHVFMHGGHGEHSRRDRQDKGGQS